MDAAHLVAAALLLSALALVPWRELDLAAPLATALVATAAWNLLRVGVSTPFSATPASAVAVISCVQLSAVSLFLATYRLVRGRLPARRAHLVGLLATAVVLATVLSWTLLTDMSDHRQSVAVALHLSYAFALLGAIVLTLRRRSSSRTRHVTHVVTAAEALLVAMAVVMSVWPRATALVGAAWCLLVVWAAVRRAAWERVTTVTSSAMDTVDVLILVVDARGSLLEWNATADRVVTMMTRTPPRRGDDVTALLEVPSPFPDGSLLDLPIDHGTMPVELIARDRGPSSSGGDQVLMLVPLDRPSTPPKDSPISGELAGHDPATQTESRAATLRRLRAAAVRRGAALRCSVELTGPLGADDALFVIARRLETCLPNWVWGRVDERVLVGTTEVDDLQHPPPVTWDNLPMEVELVLLRPGPDEDPDQFVHRVLAAPPRQASHRHGN